VVDPYGSLQRGALLRAWRAAPRGTDGGLGLQLVANSASRVLLLTLPGAATECACAFDTRARRLQLRELVWIEDADPEHAQAARAALEGGPQRSAAAGPPAAALLVVAVLLAIALALVAALALR
jgi:hypothetical protein